MAAETIRIEIPIETIDNTDSGIQSAKKGFEDLENAARKAQSEVNRANKTVSQFDKAQEKTQKGLSKWAKEKYQVVMEAKDKISPVLSEVTGGLKSLGRKSWNVVVKATDLATAPIRGIFNLLKNPLFQVGAVLGISVSLKDTVETYANFEATMSQVKALANANSDEMVKLTEKAKEMGAKTKYSGTESAEAFTYMAQAGWTVNDMIDGIGGVMSLAASDGLDLASTTDILANALTAFNLTAKDSAMFADVLAIASSATNTDVQQLGESLKYVAPVAGALGYSIQDVSLALGIMSNNAIKGSQAGTSLKTSLANMAAPTKKMREVMEKYNVSLTDGQGNMKSLRGVLDNLRSSFGGLSEKEQVAAASTLFGKEAMAGMLSIINTSSEAYDDLIGQIDDSSGAADRMAETMQDNLAGAFEELGGAIETVQLTIGERLKPYLLDLAGWIQNNMPAFEEMAVRFFDAADRKIDELKKKIADFTSSDEWKNADFFGKVHIAWDELIGKPFSEWWDNTGHELFVGKAGSIGRGIGSAVSTGILALLGIDVSGAIGEGETVGSAFAQGLIAGFDVNAIQEKLWSAIQGIFSNAAKILPGGEQADLSSWLSAALIAKVVGPILGTGIKGAKLGKTIFGSGEGGLGLGSTIMGSAAAGTGLKGLGASMGMLGFNLGSGASGAGLIAAGTAGVAGGLVGGATLVSGGMDLYKGFTSKDKVEADTYKESGAWKVGGVAGGAAVGAAIGSVVPVLGTAVGALIGAGIGGVAGWLKGDSVKKEYEEDLKAAQEAAEAVALAEEQAKYESQDLKDALADTSMTAEEFGLKFQEAVGEKLKSKFGDIKLNLQEVKDLASKIVFDDQVEGVKKFSEATTNAQNSLATLQGAVSTVDKLNWKASLGMQFSEEDIEVYKVGMENLIQGAKEYVENKHYEATVAFDLLIDASPVDTSTSLNQMYANMQEQLEGLGGELTAKVNVALEDGVITLDEEKEIVNLQNQITAITQKLTDAQTEAKFQKMKIKYSGADLDADSFADLQAEIQEEVAGLNKSYDEALEVDITNLNLELAEGVINQEQYDAQLKALTEGYEAKIDDLQVRVESFQLETIADSFETELDGILPDIEGTTAEKLSTALHNAMSSGVDPVTWDASTASQWLGLEGLSTETQTAIAGLMSQVAASLPQSVADSFAEVDMSTVDFVGPFSNEFYEQMQNADLTAATSAIGTNLTTQFGLLDFSPIGTGLSSGVGAAISGTDMGPINTAIGGLKTNTGTAIDSAFGVGFNTTAPVTITADYKLANPTATISFSGGGSGTATVSASIAQNAEGSIVNGPLLSWVGEDGPEAIIPLGSKRRSRGLSLWEKAGELLGVRKYAEGGVIGSRYGQNPLVGNEDIKYINNALNTSPELNLKAQEDTPVGTQFNVSPKTSEEETSSKTEVHVSVQVSPQFSISGGEKSENDIIRIIKSHMKEMADELGGEIATKLEAVYSNMPLKGGA